LNEEKAREILKQQGMTETEAQEFIDRVIQGVKAFNEFKSWAEIKKEVK